MIGKISRWWSNFVAANQRNGLPNTPFVNYYPTKPVRTEGAAGLGFQSLLETPLFDPSGPTVPNRRTILYAEGAVYPPVNPELVLAGVQGIINQDQFDLSGLLEPVQTSQQQASG